MKVEKVALLGAGAVGAYFIWGLSKKLGDNFCVVARGERKDRLEKEGLIINDEKFDLNVKTPEECKGADLLLIAGKHDSVAGMIPDIQTIVEDHTIVMSLLNGVTSEEIIGNAIGMEHMLYSVMRIASMRKGNTIKFSPESTPGVFVGEKGIYEPTERLLEVAKVFENTGIRFNIKDDILLEMWTKYAGNVSQNLPQAVISVGFGSYKDSEHMQFIAARLWEEVAKIANKKGIALTEKLIIFADAKNTARFSTLQDIDAGRKTEIEMLAGEMIRMGKECGVEVPYCEYTYHIIKSLEEKNDGKFDYS